MQVDMELMDDVIKVIEIEYPERMLDARTKTAMLTVATGADYYRVGADWQTLQRWRYWQHGKHVNEVNHYGEFTTSQGDILAVCPLESDLIVCQVQVTEIRMVDCHNLTDTEISELGYRDREDYRLHWGDLNEDAPHGWFMRVMLLPDEDAAVH